MSRDFLTALAMIRYRKYEETILMHVVSVRNTGCDWTMTGNKETTGLTLYCYKNVQKIYKTFS